MLLWLQIDFKNSRGSAMGAKNKNDSMDVGAWLLELHKYIPNLLPKSTNEAIGYYHFLHLLDDMFSNSLEINMSLKSCDNLFLCDERLESDYGGDGIHFQHYLNRFFYRTPHVFTWNRKRCSTFTAYWYFLSMLKQAYIGEYKFNEFRTVDYPESKEFYSDKTMYQIPYKESMQFKSFEEKYDIEFKQMTELYLTHFNYNHHLKKEERIALLQSINDSLESGNIYLDSIDELKKYTKKTNTQRRDMSKHSVISLRSHPHKIRTKVNKRDPEFEYIDDPMILNVNALKSKINKTSDTTDPSFCMFHATTLHRILYAYENEFPLVYRSKQKGLRLMNINENLSVNLQGLKKELREDIFQSYYDYDIEAAAPTIMYQLYRRVDGGENESLIHVEAYIDDKHKYRKALANLIKKHTKLEDDDAKDKAKEIYTAVLFGAKALRAQSSLKLPYDLRDAMQNDELVNGLIANIDMLYKKLDSYYKLIRKKIEGTAEAYEVHNPFGLILSFSKWEPNSVLARIYQSIERHILDLIVKKYKKQIILKVHDGFISSEKIDIQGLELYVLEASGFRVKYEFKQL
jgi:hypothetical protein